MTEWSTTRSNSLLRVSTCHRTALVSNNRYIYAYRMNYPVEGAENPPTIHKQRGIHWIPAVPSSKDNDNGDDDCTATRLLKMTAAASKGYIIRQRVPNSPPQRKKTELTDNDSASATRHITATRHFSLPLPRTTDTCALPWMTTGRKRQRKQELKEMKTQQRKWQR